MPTTGGALAFAGLVPPYEATLVANLRAAGRDRPRQDADDRARQLGRRATGMPTNYNSLNGYGFNPYDPRRDPREATFDGRPALATGGSSSGSRHRGELLGRERRHRDLRVDPQPGERQPARGGQADRRADQPPRHHSDHRRPGHRRSDGAERHRRGDPARRPRGRGARPERPGDVALRARDRLHEVPRPRRPARCAHRHSARLLLRRGEGPRKRQEPQGGLDAPHAAAMAAAIAVLQARGRDRRRSCRHPERRRPRPGAQLPAAGTSAAASTRRRRTPLLDRLRLRHGARLQSLAGLARPAAPVPTLTELRQWNRDHQKAGPLKYGQALLDFSDAMDPQRLPRALRGRPRQGPGASRRRTASTRRWRRTASTRCSSPARAARTSPPARLPDRDGAVRHGAAIADPPFPEGFDPAPLPLGVSFTGTACSEPRLLALAYAFEQATQRRVPPPGLP